MQVDYIIVVNPAGTWGYSISPLTAYYEYGGGDGFTINVTATSGCSWEAGSNEAWVNIISGGSGTGDGIVSYVVRENFTGGARVGTITIAAQTFTVFQNSTAACTYTVSPIFANFTASAGTGSINVTTSEQCAWQAVSNAGWITVLSGDMGIGNGTVDYVVAANPGPGTRKGKITLGGNTLNVKQTFH